MWGKKIEVLRAKRKCDDSESDNWIFIKNYESDPERIAWINTKFLLSQLELNENYITTGHGVIKPKKDSNIDGDVN